MYTQRGKHIIHVEGRHWSLGQVYSRRRKILLSFTYTFCGGESYSSRLLFLPPKKFPPGVNNSNKKGITQ